MMHLLWVYGLKAWIVVCVIALVVIGLICWRDARREQQLGDRP